MLRRQEAKLSVDLQLWVVPSAPLTGGILIKCTQVRLSAIRLSDTQWDGFNYKPRQDLGRQSSTVIKVVTITFSAYQSSRFGTIMSSCSSEKANDIAELKFRSLECSGPPHFCSIAGVVHSSRPFPRRSKPIACVRIHLLRTCTSTKTFRWKKSTARSLAIHLGTGTRYLR